MLINLTDIFTSEGKERTESIPYEPNNFSYMGGLYIIRDKVPALIRFTNVGKGRVLMKGGMRFALEAPCDRCLKVVKVPVELVFEQEIFSPEAVSQMEEQDQQGFMHEYELDTEEFLTSEILLNMPVKVLCKPDCKGICKKCGHNLNEGDCGCDTFVPDPRMAAIKDIFNENKEV